MTAARAQVQVENFDGFTLVRYGANPFGDDEARTCMLALRQLASRGETLVYVDLAYAQRLEANSASLLSGEIAALQAEKKVEVVLVTEPAVAAQLSASPLSQNLNLYERRDEQAVRVVTRELLETNAAQVYNGLENALDGAIQSAVKRWTGKSPIKVAEVTIAVNPSVDLVSVVEIDIDGHPCRAYLTASQSDICGLVEKILRTQIPPFDPLVGDGVCEMLNYLTAYFRQHFIISDCEVAAAPPRLLSPDEMMRLLDLDFPGRLVETEYGSFQVWYEAGI